MSNTSQNQDNKKNKIAYLISILVLLACVVGMLFWENVFSKENAKEILGSLSNVFFVPGVVFAGVGGLSKLGALGAYDTIGYMFSRFSFHNIWITNAKKQKYDSLYEYKVAKDTKGRKWFPFILWPGLASIALSVILIIVYLVI